MKIAKQQRKDVCTSMEKVCNFLGFLSGTNQFVCQDNICNINQQSNVWLLLNLTEISSLHEYDDQNVYYQTGQ